MFGFLFGFIVGGVAGAAIALVLSPQYQYEPQEGEDSESPYTKARAKEIGETVRAKVKEVLEEGRQVLHQAVEEGKEAASQRSGELGESLRKARG